MNEIQQSAYFDTWALDYDEDVRRSDEAGEYPFAGYRKLMENVMKLAKGAGEVLDIGIGTGMVSAELARNSSHITGLDFSPEMLAHVRERIAGARLLRCDFSKGLPDEALDRKYDAIISTYALHHVPCAEQVRLVEQVAGQLAPGGVLIWGDVMFDTRAALEECAERMGDEFDDSEYYCVYEEIAPSLPAHEYVRVSDCAGLIVMHRISGNT